MKKLYLVGNSHIDPVWLWRWQDGYSEVLATWRSALDRMKEFPSYKFTCACAVYYEWVEKTDPAMFEEIKERVREGRWNIVGGFYLQPDCNIPSGESFARHALISQRYFKDRFGVTARSGYNVDSFGHNASMPKILLGGGMSRYVFMRPDEHEHPLGFDNFLWRADDGSEVVASRIFYYALTSSSIDKIHRAAKQTQKDGIERMSFFGVGNHGGGPSARLISELETSRGENYVFASVDDFFDNNENCNLPVVEGELQHHARGCYSAMSEVKEMNRRCEENLLAAERLCLLAHKLVGYRYPERKLSRVWRNLLFNQFHDILAGCSIESAYRDALYHYGEIMSVTEQEINGALQAIACKVETARGEDPGRAHKEHFLVWSHERLGSPIIVFNPHAFPVKAPIRRRAECSYMTDEEGREIPFQMIRGEATNGKNDIYEVEFMAEVPAYGYRLYRTYTGREGSSFEGVRVSEHSLENSRLRVEFDSESGEISRIVSLPDGQIIASGGFGAILTDESRCDTWAHNRFDLGEVCGGFERAEFKILEAGAVCGALRVTVYNEDCTLIRDYKLYRDLDELEVELEADFRGKNKALKLCFPAKDSLRCDIPFGSIERKLCKGEEPFAKWLASERLGVANIGKYGYDSTEDGVRVTVLRGAIFADHYGVRDGRYSYMEQGIHRTKFSLFPFESASDADRRAALLNSPARVINVSFHHGTLPEKLEGIRGVADNLTVSAIKKSEDGEEIVVRVCESDGTCADCTVELLDKKIRLEVAPYAIKTVNENGEPLDFMEWKIQ